MGREGGEGAKKRIKHERNEEKEKERFEIIDINIYSFLRGNELFG